MIKKRTQTTLKTTLLVLTLNEVDGVKLILPKIDVSLFDQILIVDGGSNDGTVEWSRANGYTVYEQKRRGIRFAYLEVLPFIQGDVIVTFSPDGNCPPEILHSLMREVSKGRDLVIASRYMFTRRSEDDSWLTAFGNWLFTKTVNWLHKGRYSDCMTIYRAFKKEIVYRLDLHLDESYALPEKLFGTVISWEPLMAVRAAKCGLSVSEVPAREPARIAGVRKLQIWRWGAAYYFQFLHEIWKWKPRPRPLGADLGFDTDPPSISGDSKDHH